MDKDSSSGITFPELPDPDTFLKSIITNTAKAKSSSGSNSLLTPDLTAHGAPVYSNPAVPTTASSFPPRAPMSPQSETSGGDKSTDVNKANSGVFISDFAMFSKEKPKLFSTLLAKNSKIVNFITKVKLSSAGIDITDLDLPGIVEKEDIVTDKPSTLVESRNVQKEHINAPEQIINAQENSSTFLEESSQPELTENSSYHVKRIMLAERIASTEKIAALYTEQKAKENAERRAALYAERKAARHAAWTALKKKQFKKKIRRLKKRKKFLGKKIEPEERAEVSDIVKGRNDQLAKEREERLAMEKKLNPKKKKKKPKPLADPCKWKLVGGNNVKITENDTIQPTGISNNEDNAHGNNISNKSAEEKLESFNDHVTNTEKDEDNSKEGDDQDIKKQTCKTEGKISSPDPLEQKEDDVYTTSSWSTEKDATETDFGQSLRETTFGKRNRNKRMYTSSPEKSFDKVTSARVSKKPDDNPKKSGNNVQNTATNSGNPIQSTNPQEADEDDEIMVLDVSSKVIPLVDIGSDDEQLSTPAVDNYNNQSVCGEIGYDEYSEYKEIIELGCEKNVQSLKSNSNRGLEIRSEIEQKSEDAGRGEEERKRNDEASGSCQSHINYPHSSNTNTNINNPNLNSENSCSLHTDLNSQPLVEGAEQTIDGGFAQIPDFAILNLINEVKSSRQHRNPMQLDDRCLNDQVVNPESCVRPNIKDRLGERVNIRDSLGERISIRDRLGERVMDESELESNAHIDRTDKELDMCPSRDAPEQSRSPHPEELEFVEDLELGFPYDVDGFQTLSEADSDEIKRDEERRRRRRSAKERLGGRASGRDEDSRHRRRSYSPHHYRSHRYNPSHRHSPSHRRFSPSHRRPSPSHRSRHWRSRSPIRRPRDQRDRRSPPARHSSSSGHRPRLDSGGSGCNGLEQRRDEEPPEHVDYRYSVQIGLERNQSPA